MIKELKCPNCGGPLIHQGWGKYKCEYCNSIFENKDEFGNVHIIERERPGIVTLGTKSVIPDDIFYHYQKSGNTEAFYAQVKHELAYQLAEGLTKYLDVKYSMNFKDMSTDCYAYVKVLDPASERYRY